MSVRFRLENSVNPQLSAMDSTSSQLLTPSFPVSVSVWFRIETSDTTGAQILWWYGDSSASTNHLLLQFNNTNNKLQLDAGSGYSSIPTVDSNAISRNEWHLVTVVIAYVGTTLTHTMYVDEDVFGTTQTVGTTPPVSAWDRVTVGRRDATPIRPLDGYIEQLAIWTTTALSQSDHDKMFSDSTFNGLRRAPDALSTPRPARRTQHRSRPRLTFYAKPDVFHCWEFRPGQPAEA